MARAWLIGFWDIAPMLASDLRTAGISDQDQVMNALRVELKKRTLNARPNDFDKWWAAAFYDSKADMGVPLPTEGTVISLKGKDAGRVVIWVSNAKAKPRMLLGDSAQRPVKFSFFSGQSK